MTPLAGLRVGPMGFISVVFVSAVCAAAYSGEATSTLATQTAQTATVGAQKVQLGVYFESRCPDSKRFFVNQLLPTYQQLADYIEPTLVAFGHARTLQPSNRMICQHGARECEGNRLMACVQARSGDQLKVIETIVCLFEAKQTAKECLGKHLPSLSYDDIDKCKNSDESFKMMVTNEGLTGRVNYVPEIRIGNNHTEEIQDECEHELKKCICKRIIGTQPELCKPDESSATP